MFYGNVLWNDEQAIADTSFFLNPLSKSSRCENVLPS